MFRQRLYVLRDGESQFNEAYDATGGDPGIPDAGLTERGRKQASAAGEEIRRVSPQLVVTSPYTRAIDTALAVLPAPKTPLHVKPLVRERVGDACDIGTPASRLADAYPHLDFAHLEEVWWSTDGPTDERGIPIEARERVNERVRQFRAWLATRDESSVLVVSHRGFIHGLAGLELANGEFARVQLAT